MPVHRFLFSNASTENVDEKKTKYSAYQFELHMNVGQKQLQWQNSKQLVDCFMDRKLVGVHKKSNNQKA